MTSLRCASGMIGMQRIFDNSHGEDERKKRIKDCES